MGHNLGIIGFGGMGGHHGANASKAEGLNVRAVYDVRESQVKLAEEKGMIGYRDLDAFLADEEIDIVLIATPNNYHKDLAIKALKAGKNVICEKPATMNTAEFDEIAATAQECGKIFTCHHNRRWDKDYRSVRKTVESGDLGKVYFYESRIHGKNGKMIDWRDRKENGGGVLLDWAPHLVDQILQMQKEKVVSVYCQKFNVCSDNVETYFKLLLRFESGCGAMVEVGTLCLYDGPRWVIHGDGGSMMMKTLGSTEGEIVKDKAHLVEWKAEIVDYGQGPTRTMAPRPLNTMEFKEPPAVEDLVPWEVFYGNLMKAIDGEAELAVKPAEVRRVMQIIDAANESERTGSSVICCI